MEFVSNNNKSLLWELLQENNIFNGISNNQFNNIHVLFENTINNIDKLHSGMSLLNKNKIAMDELVKQINIEKRKETYSEPKIQMIYKSQDLKMQRENEFNIK